MKVEVAVQGSPSSIVQRPVDVTEATLNLREDSPLVFVLCSYRY